MLTAYVPYQSLSSTRTESTVFEQVYGIHRRRPTSISLNVQWIPVVDRSSINIWNTSDMNNRKLKTETFFETGTMRKQQQSKAITPPSSDYTDAYLNAFAPKPISAKRFYRINAPVFANVAPMRTNLSLNSSIRTSQTRFNNINNNQTSNLFNKTVPLVPRSNSNYSSSFIPDIFPKYEPSSSTQSFLSETQTYNTNNSTLLRNRQSSKTTIHASPQPSSSYQSESLHKNGHKPMPPNSLQSYPSSSATPLSPPSPISTYKPSVSFQSIPLSFSNNIRQSSTNGQTVLQSLNTEKQIERPETLLFQHDEDIRSSCIEKPSPIITPLLESPIIRVESKTESERTSIEDLSTVSSKPIEILEKTISKYDSIIDQISEVLASVSPLSSTLSSMSPGKSVLDYELTSDGSPILQRKHIESQPSQESTTPVRSTNIQRVKGKYLIRDDSYDKIITAITDLDNELTPPPDNEKAITTVIEEEKEESVTQSSEDHRMSSSSEQLKDEVKTLLFNKQTPSSLTEKKEEAEVLQQNEQQLLSVIKSEENEHQTSLTSPIDVWSSELCPLNETKLDDEIFVNVQSKTETPLDNTEFVQQQTDLLSNIPIVETTQKEISRSNDELTSKKNNGKRVRWSEIVVANEDDKSSSYQSLKGEGSLSEAPIEITEKERLTLDESTTVVEQQINSSISIENLVMDDQINLLTSIEPSSSNDQQIISTESTEPLTNVIEPQIESSSSPETSSSFSECVDRETSSSDLNESQSSHDEQITSSRSSGDIQFISNTDFSNKNTSTVDEQSSTILDVVTNENMDLQLEEIESNKTDTPIQLDDVTTNETIENTPLLSLPIIESPINTLTDSISTRYISSDVYHSYLGDHTQFIENLSDIDTENMKISLVASLRQTIATSATPLIETIQSVVSSRRTLTTSQPLKNENEMIDYQQNDTRPSNAMIADSNEQNNEHEAQIDESKPTVDTFEESKTMFESLRDTITESMPNIVSNLQADKQAVITTSNTEPVSEILTITEDVTDLTTLELTPTHDNTGLLVEKFDDHSINETELTPSIQTQTPEKQILASLPLDTSHDESIDNPMDASVILTTLSNIAPPTNAPSSEIPILSSVEDKTIESITPTPIVQGDEQMLTTNAVLSEPIDTGDTEEVTHFNFTPEVSDVTISEQKIDEIKTSLDETKHPLATITEKIDSVISPSLIEENLLVIEQDFASTDDHPNPEQVISTKTIRDQPSNAALLKDDVTDTNKTDAQIASTSPIMTELTSKFETDELMSASNKENEPIFQTIHELINDINQTVLSQLQQYSIETKQEILSSNSGLTQSIIPQINNLMQRSATEPQSDSTSVKIEIENNPSKSSVNFRESSPTNTEPDSFELMNALRGHSIVLPYSPEQIYYRPEESPSTTTSSQITSSDYYVSYAIHQMGDSSQERLPSFPIAADIPVYKTIEEDILLKPIIIDNRLILKEDDSTEFDATENLTSYSDDLLLQRLHTSTMNRQKNFDTSSTDDDVDEEIEQHDLTDLERLLDKLTLPNTSSNINEEAYQRYDLATTSSSNDSSSSPRQQPDNIYFIPGYSGLWRPSSDNDNKILPIDYDADDERKTATKTRTIVRTFNSTKRPLIFEYPQNQPENLTSSIPLRPDSIDIYNRPINEFSFDISESDSYQTCPSSKSKEEQHQISPEENIFLIRENERGVSLPITMKINFDDIAFRLSTSSPIDTQLYSRTQLNLSSPSTHSEPPLPINIDSNSQASSPSSSDQQKLSSWLNTINTVTTTTEESGGPLASHITLLKSAKGPISISECHPQGYYIIIENTSRSKHIDLINWKIQQENDNGDNLSFTFPDHFLLKPNHSLKILTETNQSEQRTDDLIALSLSSWHRGPNILTTLINPDGKDCATLTKKTIFS